jgi:chromosome segregation ATPase
LRVVEADELSAAELAYQRALTALHEARAELSDVAAARRRFAFDRTRMSAEAAAARAAELDTAHAALTARVDALREQASALRAGLRRLTDDTGSEPDDVPEEPEGEGFQQPPFEAKP